MIRADPGNCPICDAPHCSCGGGPIVVTQLPQRDAAAAAVAVPPLVATAVQSTLPDGQFTAATYRRSKKAP